VIDAGEITGQVGITMDWTATFRRLAGSGPDPLGEDGIDLLPILRSGEQEKSRTLFWRRKHGPKRKGFDEGRAVRHGRWKLIEQKEGNEQFLFDLATDPGETKNLIANRPHLASELHEKLDRWEELVD
jgi:arylsulfatase A-like enzyme